MDDIYPVTVNIYQHGRRADKILISLSLVPRVGEHLLLPSRKNQDGDMAVKVSEVWHVISKERRTEEIILDCEVVD